MSRQARISQVEDTDPGVRETLAKTLADPEGQPLNIFLTLAQHPRLLKRFNILAGTFLAHGRLDPRERELVVLRTAWRTGCSYEWGQHVLIARDAGVAPEELERVAQEPLEGWGDRERTLLQFADELLADVDVSDPTWDAAAAFLDEQQLIELVMLVGLYRMVSGFLNSVGVPREEHLPPLPHHPPPNESA